MVKKTQFLHWLLAGCILTVMIGCSDKNRVPSSVLPREKMQKILWDMIQADRFAAAYVLKDSATKNVKEETFKLYEQVFQVNEVTREEFVKSYKYYLSRPDITRVMLDSLAAEANRRREEMYRDTARAIKPVAVDSAARNLKRVPVDTAVKNIKRIGVDTAAKLLRRKITTGSGSKPLSKPQ